MILWKSSILGFSTSISKPLSFNPERRLTESWNRASASTETYRVLSCSEEDDPLGLLLVKAFFDIFFNTQAEISLLTHEKPLLAEFSGRVFPLLWEIIFYLRPFNIKNQLKFPPNFNSMASSFQMPIRSINPTKIIPSKE